MGKRGPKPKQTISTRWSPNLAYAVGLIATDGCLYQDGRHIDLTSRDREQLENFQVCLDIQIPITPKRSGGGFESLRVQFSNVHFYQFLQSLGLTPRKSKTMPALAIPDRYFFHFLRGHLDGDGSFYSYTDPRWKSSFMFYTAFVSGSPPHISWLRNTVSRLIGIQGHITTSKRSSVQQLKYAKKESAILLKALYPNRACICLTRKREKIAKATKMV